MYNNKDAYTYSQKRANYTATNNGDYFDLQQPSLKMLRKKVDRYRTCPPFPQDIDTYFNIMKFLYFVKVKLLVVQNVS